MYNTQGKKKQKEQYPVYPRITVAGKRAEIATNVMVNIDRWNASKGRLIGTVEETRRLNHLLDDFEHKAREIYDRQLLGQENFTAESIKNEITGIEHKKRILVSTFEEHVKQMELREGNGFTKGTIKNWKVTLGHLRQFVSERYTTNDITFRQLNQQFIFDLDWFARTKWNCKTNAVLKHFQRIQKVVKVAMLKGWIQKNPFDNFHFKQEPHKKIQQDKMALANIILKEILDEQQKANTIITEQAKKIEHLTSTITSYNERLKDTKFVGHPTSTKPVEDIVKKGILKWNLL